jgi:hypothetical protein
MLPSNNPQQDSLTEPVIQNGVCYVLFAYDAARSINLDEAERQIQEMTKRETIKHKRRAPSYFEYQPPPLRRTQAFCESFRLWKVSTKKFPIRPRTAGWRYWNG